jgi:glycosyltransferase involved in cell wall biosynthesis
VISSLVASAPSSPPLAPVDVPAGHCEAGNVAAPSPLGQSQSLVSFIVPMMNEQENAPLLMEEIQAVASAMARPYEIIVVDDGSTDGTVASLAPYVGMMPLTVVVMRRNFGQTAAMSAGFSYARGDIFVTLDGDLQNNPHDAIPMIERLERDGLDIVAGWRQGRQDAAISRKLPSWIANRIIGWATGVTLHDYGCSLKVYRADMARDLSMYGEMHRFIPALATLEGARLAEVPVSHRARQFGVSKYNISRTVKVILDLMTVLMMKRFFTRPLHLFGRLGLLLLLVGTLGAGYLIGIKVLFGASIGHRPLLMLSVMSLLAGLQLVCTGLLAEIQVRTYFESQDKPIYRVRTLLQAQTP